MNYQLRSAGDRNTKFSVATFNVREEDQLMNWQKIDSVKWDVIGFFWLKIEEC